MISPAVPIRWKWCLITALAMVLLSMIPQIHLWIARGGNWNGAYVSAFIDEPFYASYVNALIDGRPRRNDPFGARDDSTERQLPESLYSIQFVPAYLVALPARWLGVSASTAFILLTPIVVFLAAVSVFLLLSHVTADARIATAGTLFVLCLGGLFGSYGLFREPIDIAFPVVPFIRRYQPSATFPIYILFGFLLWVSLTTKHLRRSRIAALLAGLAVALLIFSYLYLWTAAVAWLICVGLLWFALRPDDRPRTLATVAIIIGAALLAFVPYSHLISQRAASTDDQQILLATHTPELFHVHELIAACLLVALGFGVVRRRIAQSDPRSIFAGSIALLPFVVFNQQVITGRTLQAFHFEIYCVNYSLAFGIVITLSLLWKRIPDRFLVWVAALCFAWGLIAIGLPARVIGINLATAADETIPVLLRLKQLSNKDGTFAGLRSRGEAATLVFSPNVRLIMQLPSWTSQGTLLDITGGDCAGITREERTRFFYMHLYYSNVDVTALRQALTGSVPPSPNSLLLVRSIVFGHARIYPGLTSRFVPVQAQEIEHEVQNYETYTNSFSREEAFKRPIAYAVIPEEGNFDFTNLDRWYDRDAGERVGDYVLYRLKLRP